MRRSRARDVAVCGLQMWAYVAAYKSPHDDPNAQERRVHVAYPIAADRVLGLGELPTVRLQRALARQGPDGPGVARARPGARVGALELVRGAARLARLHAAAPPQRFPRAAVMTYAVFDIGASFYWVVPDRAALVRRGGGCRPARMRRRRCGG